MRRSYCNLRKSPPEPPKGTPSTSITPQQFPAYPYPATPTSSTSLTRPLPSNAPPRSVAPPYASPGARTASTWNTTPGPPSLGRPPTANCAPWRTPHRHTTACNDPVPQYLGSRGRHGRHPPHQAPRGPAPPQGTRIWPHHTGVGTMDGLQGHAPQGRPTHRQTYGNGRADTHAKHQSTSHTPGLEHVQLDTPHHSHLQHLPPIPSATQPPQWMPEDTPYTDGDKQYHYPTPIQQLATTLGHPANTELLRRLEDSVQTPLYYSALRPDSLPAHLQKPQLQLALEQLPVLSRYHRWYARRSINVPARYTKCICGHAEEETCDHFKGCPLYRGLDTLTDWNPTHTIAQHARWPTRSPATQQLATVLKQTEVLDAVRRGLVPAAVYTLLRTHAEDPQATAAHMKRTAIAKTAEQFTYRAHRYLQHAVTLPQTDQAHLLKLLFYQP